MPRGWGRVAEDAGGRGGLSALLHREGCFWVLGSGLARGVWLAADGEAVTGYEVASWHKLNWFFTLYAAAQARHDCSSIQQHPMPTSQDSRLTRAKIQESRTNN